MPDASVGPVALSTVGTANVVVVRDPHEARTVLEDTTTFRVAHMGEYVPGLSSSFFLAADMSDQEGTDRCHRELAAYLAPARSPGLQRAFRHAAEATIEQLPRARPFDMDDALLRPYGRRVACALSGMSLADGGQLIDVLRAASELSGSPKAAQSTLKWVWNWLYVAATENTAFSAPGLPAFALARGIVSSREVALLTMPLLEMAAYDRNTAIVRNALLGLRRNGLAISEVAGDLRELLWRAAASIERLVITRVANASVELGAGRVRPGDRVLVDVVAVNRSELERSADDGLAIPHIAFGWGRHACIARELSIGIGLALLESMLKIGDLQPTDGKSESRWTLS